VIQVFDRLGLEYLIGGSVASSLYGIPRSTNDVDLVVALEPRHVAQLIEAFQSEFAIDADTIRKAIDERRPFNLIHSESLVKIDIFVMSAEPWLKQEMVRRRAAPLLGVAGGRSAFYASPEDMVLSKLRWFHLGGGVSDRQWLDIVGILRIQGAALDIEYLVHWAEHLGVAALLARARVDADA
jgi:hypothetical protein